MIGCRAAKAPSAPFQIKGRVCPCPILTMNPSNFFAGQQGAFQAPNNANRDRRETLSCGLVLYLTRC